MITFYRMNQILKMFFRNILFKREMNVSAQDIILFARAILKPFGRYRNATCNLYRVL